MYGLKIGDIVGQVVYMCAVRVLTLELVTQRNCGCLTPGSIQGQVECDFEQPNLAEGVRAHGRGIGTR